LLTHNVFKKICIASYPTRNVFKKNCIAGCITRNVFKKSFILRVVQPAIYLKKVLYCGLYNPQCKRCRKYNCGLYNL